MFLYDNVIKALPLTDVDSTQFLIPNLQTFSITKCEGSSLPEFLHLLKSRAYVLPAGCSRLERVTVNDCGNLRHIKSELEACGVEIL